MTDVTEAMDAGDSGVGPAASGSTAADGTMADGTMANGGDAAADTSAGRARLNTPGDAGSRVTDVSGDSALESEVDGKADATPDPTAGDGPGTSAASPDGQKTGALEGGTDGSEGDSTIWNGPLDAGGADCGAPTLGGIPLANDYASQGGGVPGSGGFAYAYSDSVPPGTGTSISCIGANAFCGKIATGAMTTSTWGAGIGVNLNQQPSSNAVGTFAATGSGISYILSALSPQGMRIFIDNAGVGYCANLTSAAGTVPWSSFNTVCWQPDAGAGLAGPPAKATYINFQVSAAAAPGLQFLCSVPDVRTVAVAWPQGEFAFCQETY